MPFRILELSLALAVALGVADLAEAQVVKPYAGEIIMTVDGQLVGPWREGKSCAKDGKVCRAMVLNPNTKEVARLDGKWSSKFEATGNGQEVRRAETTMAKAVRLEGDGTRP